jgi:hypothetical protein
MQSRQILSSKQQRPQSRRSLKGIINNDTHITSRSEAQEEADRLNVINQSVIGAKEGVVKALTKLVGSNITDAVLTNSRWQLPQEH